MRKFKNKIVSITGAASGMGAAYAKAFANLGSNLALCDINLVLLEKTKQEILASNKQIKIYTQKVDVSSKEEVYDFAENVKNNLGNTHIIINNAGVEGAIVPIYDLEIEQMERIMNINYWSVVYGTKAFLPQLVDNNEGAVVNVSSIMGLIGAPNFGEYVSSKFAVRGFTETLMIEFIESPISIHCVHPGGINTAISKHKEGAAFAEKYLSTPPEDIAKYVINSIKIGRSKIVYGKDSLKTLLGSNLVPNNILHKIIWNEIKQTLDLSAYKKFIPKL